MIQWLKDFFAVQKMGRADAKKAASKADKAFKSDYVDPLLFWKIAKKVIHLCQE